MKHCDKCNVNIRGNETVCPLCQNSLQGAAHEEVYPDVPSTYRQFSLFFKLLILCTIAGCITCVAINIILPKSGFWSVLVLLGALSFWTTLAYAIRKKDNIAKDITVWVLIISLFSIVWDCSTGWHGWSLNFAFPIACGFSVVSLTILSKVMKLRGEDYIIYLVVDICIGAVPILLFAAGIISVVIPSAICMALSIVSITALILFEGKNILDEIKKNFHV
jgi:hypothetical protein